MVGTLALQFDRLNKGLRSSWKPCFLFEMAFFGECLSRYTHSFPGVQCRFMVGVWDKLLGFLASTKCVIPRDVNLQYC